MAGRGRGGGEESKKGMSYVLPQHLNKIVRVWDAAGKIWEGKCIGVNALGQRNTIKLQFVGDDGTVQWKFVGRVRRVDEIPESSSR